MKSVSDVIATVNRKKSPKSKLADAETTETTNDLFYRNDLTTIRTAIPWRLLMHDAHGRHIDPHGRPSAATSPPGEGK